MEYRFSQVQRLEIVQKSSQCLWTKEGAPGLEHLTGFRKLSPEIIKEFNLGYIPSHVNHQLAGRIIMPLYDPSGNLICITTRLIDKNDILPIHWHERYEKSFYLYGILQSKEWMRKWKFSVIVEGQFDVLQMHNHGMKNTLGLCCNKLSDVQKSVIYRYCRELVVLMDVDKNSAGQEAAEKIVSTAWDGKNHCREYRDKIAAVQLDEVLDPDEYIRKHGILPVKAAIKKTIQELRTNV